MSHSKKWLFTSLFIFLINLTSAKAYENPLFGYTHLLPSPFTLHAGKFAVGTSAGVGITDSLELDTNLLLDLVKIYNARLRYSLLDFPGFSVGVFLGFQSTNLSDLSSFNPALTVNAWMPGAVIGMEITPDLAIFMGGNLFYPNQTIDASSLNTAGYFQGRQIEADLSWAYHSTETELGNVLSAGVNYNSTFDLYGYGISHHWKGFHLGVHYYPTATELKIQPIIAGGAVFDI